MPSGSDHRIEQATARMLGDQVAAFVRAFGLHRPESTPCGEPIPVSEAHALMELDGSEPITQTVLGQRLQLEKSTVSRLVTMLVERGWVRRSVDPQDRRAAALQLTAGGRTAAARLAAARANRFEAVLAAIDEEDRDVVLAGLSLLTQAIREQ